MILMCAKPEKNYCNLTLIIVYIVYDFKCIFCNRQEFAVNFKFIKVQNDDSTRRTQTMKRL